VNAGGVVVGMSVNEESALVPFVYRDGVMTQLDELVPGPWVADYVGSGAINDAGQIAVSAYIPGEPGAHALLLTPDTSTGVAVAERAGEGSAGRDGFRLYATGSEVRFRLPESAPVSLRLYDLSGRLVARLAAGLYPGGEHRVAWDGATLRGGRAGSGVYFARLETPAGAGTCRVVRLR
jgi:probable HAF family extracellular repeat protein